jgi:hypothetical protein
MSFEMKNIITAGRVEQLATTGAVQLPELIGYRRISEAVSGREDPVFLAVVEAVNAVIKSDTMCFGGGIVTTLAKRRPEEEPGLHLDFMADITVEVSGMSMLHALNPGANERLVTAGRGPVISDELQTFFYAKGPILIAQKDFPEGEAGREPRQTWHGGARDSWSDLWMCDSDRKNIPLS